SGCSRAGALVFPVYKGTFERRSALVIGDLVPKNLHRDALVAFAKDLGRTIDYVESRQDLHARKVGYFGVSWGAAVGSVLLAVETRPKAAIVVGAGFDTSRPLPEADELNFAPRVRMPLLMLNGRFDRFLPVESTQQPMFDRLGTPAGQKRFVLVESGHAPPRNELIKEAIPWLDRWLGSVR
ncbi:MAG: hypothetical protein ABIT01_19220, partial [Thermoanaerobaculia bacterium]